jgi:Fe-S oxidoreductase
MALEDYRVDMEGCAKCSLCRFVPMEKLSGKAHSYVCPSVAKFNFTTYSGGGRLALGSAILDKRVDCDDKVLGIIYDCQMCGACDVSCKYAIDMEVIEPISELRNHCVQAGRTVPALDSVVASLENHGTMVPDAQVSRGAWAQDLEAPNYTRTATEVVFHAGCRVRSDPSLWKGAQAAVALLRHAGVDVGIGNEMELCCGGRAYHMGYRDAFVKHSKKVSKLLNGSKVKTLVTGCAECYQCFKVLYEKCGIERDFQVFHISQYLAALVKQGQLKLVREVPMTVTYHDPCYLGRLGEPYIPWSGRELPGPWRVFDPPREFMRGTYGVYEPPRELLKAVPGLRVLEMDRIKEYAWCCGAGGGVRESNPGFADWTAAERIQEARSTGASAIVTACPGCQHGLGAACTKEKGGLDVYDISEIVGQAVL